MNSWLAKQYSGPAIGLIVGIIMGVSLYSVFIEFFSDPINSLYTELNSYVTKSNKIVGKFGPISVSSDELYYFDPAKDMVLKGNSQQDSLLTRRILLRKLIVREFLETPTPDSLLNSPETIARYEYFLEDLFFTSHIDRNNIRNKVISDRRLPPEIIKELADRSGKSVATIDKTQNTIIDTLTMKEYQLKKQQMIKSLLEKYGRMEVYNEK